MGEPEMVPQEGKRQAVPVDTYGGRVHVEWDPQAVVTVIGQLPFFIDFLKTANLFEPWVNECPLSYTSPNAPLNVNVPGTALVADPEPDLPMVLEGGAAQMAKAAGKYVRAIVR